MKTKTGCIYRIYHLESGKSYIGQTVHFDKRIRVHLNGHSDCPALQRAVKKYGKEAFDVEVLVSNVPQDDLPKMEAWYIYFFNSQAPNGYNLTAGGEGMVDPSEETRKKMASNGFSGKKHTAETRTKQSNAQKGKKKSLEHRRNMSKSRKGNPSPRKGTTHTPEAIEKMRQAQKGKTLSPEHRRKISEGLKLSGRIYSPEELERLRQSNIGRKHTPETRKKLSENAKGRTPWNKGKKGVYSDETLEKMGEAKRNITPETRAKMRESAKLRERKKKMRESR